MSFFEDGRERGGEYGNRTKIQIPQNTYLPHTVRHWQVLH